MEIKLERIKDLENFLDETMKSEKTEFEETKKKIAQKEIRAYKEGSKLPNQQDILDKYELEIISRIEYLSQRDFYDKIKDKLYEIFPELNGYKTR